MSFKKYFDKEDGRDYWCVQIHMRSKVNRKIRIQKRLIKIKTEEEAKKLYEMNFHSICREIARRESEGLSWGEVLEKWELWYRRFPSRRWDPGTVRDYIALNRNWASEWLGKPVSKLTVSDGFQLIESCRSKGASAKLLYQLRTAINVVFKWGMSSGNIVGKDHSPMFSVELPKGEEDLEPEILTRSQFADLLERARTLEHDWYPLWKFDAHTGLRASELDGLRKKDIDLVSREKALELDRSTDPNKNYGFIRVCRQWKQKLKRYGQLKGRYWRTVPVSSQLYWFLAEYLKNDFGSDEHGERLFPVYDDLRRGQQAAVLRAFCETQGLQSIKFHTIRACWATHLLAAGVSEIKVMKMGGWKDRETMMKYIRLSGVDESGGTEALDLTPMKASEPEPRYSNVVSLFGQSK